VPGPRPPETVPLKYLRTLLRVAKEQGYDPAQVVARLGLPRELLSTRADPLQAVSAAHYNAVYTDVMAMLQDESLGVSMKQPHPAGTFRMMALFLIHCDNLEQALVRAVEFQSFCRTLVGAPPLTHQALRPLNDGLVLNAFPDSSEFAAQGTDLARYSVAHTLAIWRRFCSWLIGSRIELHEVHIQLPPSPAGNLEQRIFECPVLFGMPHNGFVFEARHLSAPLLHDEDSLRKFLRNAPYHLLANTEVDSDEGILAQMRRIVGQDLSQDFPSVIEMAERLNVSVRTLRRRLKDEGTTYQAFKDHTRRDAATALLSRPELKINAIAALLGFDEPSAFHRSFKKWTGLTPGDYRQSLLHH
jgi:AraC-like DNA-binding protein